MSGNGQRTSDWRGAEEASHREIFSAEHRIEKFLASSNRCAVQGEEDLGGVEEEEGVQSGVGKDNTGGSEEEEELDCDGEEEEEEE